MRPASAQVYLDALFADAGLVKLRHIDDKTVTSILFDNPSQLIRTARDMADSGNLYTTLNAPALRTGLNRPGRAMSDADISHIVRLPFDFDPILPTDTCSTDDELAAALVTRDGFVQRMFTRGWPLPLIGMSGNGAHAQYRCRLRNTDETRQALKAIYYGLCDEAEEPGVSFDRTVRNPSRIFRLYGSTNRKGPDLKFRPHRQAFCALPERWQQVSERKVMALAEHYARQAPQRSAVPRESAARIEGVGDYRTLDIVGWFASRGLYKRPSDDPGKHYVICPWVNEHSSADEPHKTDTVVWEAAGAWPQFHCSHDHCEGRSIRDVISLLGDADRYCTGNWEMAR